MSMELMLLAPCLDWLNFWTFGKFLGEEDIPAPINISYYSWWKPVLTIPSKVGELRSLTESKKDKANNPFVAVL